VTKTKNYERTVFLSVHLTKACR